MRPSVFAVALVVFLVLQVSPARSFINLEQFRRDFLNSANEFRRRHGVDDLQLSATVNSVAQEWADKLASEDKVYLRPNNKYGECIYMVNAGDPDGTAVARAFYNQIKDYDFLNPGFSMATFLFTQLVWRGSENLGIGVAKNQKGGTFVVANFDPKGNYRGQYEYNVPRPIHIN